MDDAWTKSLSQPCPSELPRQTLLRIKTNMPVNFIRAVIFDFGGTLMYGRSGWDPFIAKADDALTKYLRSQGLELNLNTFPREFRRRLDTYFNQRDSNLIESTYTSVLREILREKGH